MPNLINLKICLVEQAVSEIVQCFAVDGNFRINLPYTFDSKRNLLSIKADVEPRWLLIIDTANNSLELEASECL